MMRDNDDCKASHTCPTFLLLDEILVKFIYCREMGISVKVKYFEDLLWSMLYQITIFTDGPIKGK
jgi:hypothetical protein